MKLKRILLYIGCYILFSFCSAGLIVSLVKSESEKAFFVTAKLTGIMGPSGFLAWEMIIPGLATPFAIVIMCIGVILFGLIGNAQ